MRIDGRDKELVTKGWYPMIRKSTCQLPQLKKKEGESEVSREFKSRELQREPEAREKIRSVRSEVSEVGAV